MNATIEVVTFDALRAFAQGVIVGALLVYIIYGGTVFVTQAIYSRSDEGRQTPKDQGPSPQASARADAREA